MRGGADVRGGFTLIEMLAVTAIFAMLAALALPGFGLRAGRASEEEAKALAAALEFARQRAVATGAPHRLLLDIDEAGYRLEWLVTAARARGEAEPELPAVHSIEDDQEVPMAAPQAAAASFRPVTTTLGRWSVLPAEVEFGAIEAGAVRATEGRVEIRFEQDGTAEATEIFLEDEAGGAWVVSVAPLADVIRVRRAGS